MGLSSSFHHIRENPLARKEYFACTAATLFLFVSMVLIPVVGLFLGALTPLPTIVFLYRWGVGTGLWVPSTAALLSALLFPPLGLASSLPFFFGFLLMGVLMGTGVRSGWSMEKTIAVPVGVVILLGSVMAYLALSDMEEGFVARLERDVQSTVSGMVRELAPDSPERSALEHSLVSTVPVVVRMIPGVLASSLLVVCWLNILAAGRYCRLRGIDWPQWPHWTLWKAPEMLVWGVIGAGAAVLLPSTTVKFTALNVLLVLGTVYFFQGLAVVGFHLEKWKAPRFVRAILFVFIFFQQFVTLGVMLFGFFDVWFDFRKDSRKGDGPPVQRNDER